MIARGRGRGNATRIQFSARLPPPTKLSVNYLAHLPWAMYGSRYGNGLQTTPIHSATLVDRHSMASNDDDDNELDIPLFDLDLEPLSEWRSADELERRTTGDMSNPVSDAGDGGHAGIPARSPRGAAVSSVDNENCRRNGRQECTLNNGTQDGTQRRTSKRTQVQLEHNE